MRRAAVAAAVLVILAGVLAGLLPALTRDRDYPAEIPSPPALRETSLVDLPAGARACWPYAVVEHHAGEARFKVTTRGRPGAPLVLGLTGDGYRARVAVPAGYPDNSELHVAVPRPARDAEVVTCLRNAGRRAVALYASRDRTRSRSLASVDGRPTGASVWFSLYEPRPVSLLDRLGATMPRMSAFRAGVVGPWLLWPLALLFVLGVPAGTVWAYARALRDDDLALEPAGELGPGDVGGDDARERERVAGRGDGA
jgi:hypothetical protein